MTPYFETETHGAPDAPCLGQWCCGCAVHPMGKPWGWNSEAWAVHYGECPKYQTTTPEASPVPCPETKKEDEHDASE